jgi:hypothetical protein
VDSRVVVSTKEVTEQGQTVDVAYQLRSRVVSRSGPETKADKETRGLKWSVHPGVKIWYQIRGMLRRLTRLILRQVIRTI